MRLTTIALGHLRRGKARAALVVAGLTLGVATAVALANVTLALERHLGEELDRYGANIVLDQVSLEIARARFADRRRLGPDDLVSLNLLVRHGGKQVPTVGGFILFGRDRLRRFPDHVRRPRQHRRPA